MFRHYCRKDANFACWMNARSPYFKSVQSGGKATAIQGAFPIPVHEDEFVLLFELTPKRVATGKELTLHVTSISGFNHDDLVVMDVVREDPDRYWLTQTLGDHLRGVQ